MSIAYQPEPITREGFERLRAELEQLVTIKRREVADALREAREDGGEPGDNAGIAAALDERVSLERRIDELEAALAAVVIAEPPADGVAGIGQRVRIRLATGGAATDYHLVGAVECDPGRRRISVESPVGRALVGRRAGDVVEVDTPGGLRSFEIIAVGRET